ncbi:amidohydrolase family protein [Caenimonas sedimenti]|uniref:Amidohydrolase family protein n=1 Tax=Caenimonas sedimenti TaxID=2596921 RepID=A0A562ZES7_9BURK|nr:amidohydrolase family protein [Caenimonas sedimenti]TWO66051.1 amidohydrolase family protein [Caenimonas sedimenti]
MKETVSKGLRFCAAAAALLGMAWITTACGGSDNNDDPALQAAIEAAERAAPAGKRPIVETHIHFWQTSRPGGVPWPTAAEGPIFRDVLPPEYSAFAKSQGVVAAGIVEASGIVADNQWILDLVKNDPFYSFFVGNLEIGSPTFTADLARFAADPRFVGIRGYLTGPAEGITLTTAQLTNLRDLADRGMTLDLISRGTKNPKSQVQALCTAVPNLRIIIDHLGGASGQAVNATWEADIRRLASACPNMYMKFSSFYDMYAPGDVVFASPTDLASYKPHFDVLMSAFGADRLIWGSNWPVIELHGTFAAQIAIAEAYLAPMGAGVRDKVMFKNALAFYRRVKK